MKQIAIITATVIILGTIVTTIAVSRYYGRLEDQTFKPWNTCSGLLYLADSGCGDFKKQHGVWPNSLTTLCQFRADLAENSRDAWGHDFVFVPYNEAFGYGEIISYGRDGKAGGIGDDCDLMIRFPTKANADWNKQQALGVPLPTRFKDWTNWYEQYNE